MPARLSQVPPPPLTSGVNLSKSLVLFPPPRDGMPPPSAAGGRGQLGHEKRLEQRRHVVSHVSACQVSACQSSNGSAVLLLAFVTACPSPPFYSSLTFHVPALKLQLNKRPLLCPCLIMQMPVLLRCDPHPRPPQSLCEPVQNSVAWGPQLLTSLKLLRVLVSKVWVNELYV